MQLISRLSKQFLALPSPITILIHLRFSPPIVFSFFNLFVEFYTLVIENVFTPHFLSLWVFVGEADRGTHTSILPSSWHATRHLTPIPVTRSLSQHHLRNKKKKEATHVQQQYTHPPLLSSLSLSLLFVINSPIYLHLTTHKTKTLQQHHVHKLASPSWQST